MLLLDYESVCGADDKQQIEHLTVGMYACYNIWCMQVDLACFVCPLVVDLIVCCMNRCNGDN